MKNTDKFILLLIFGVLNIGVLYYISTFFNIWYGLLTVGVISFCIGKTIAGRNTNKNIKEKQTTQIKQATQTKQVPQNNQKKRYKEHNSYEKRGIGNGNKK